MLRTYRRLILLASCLVLVGRLAAATVDQPRRVILLIGDGMGTSQLTAAQVLLGQLEVAACPVVGLVTTHSANALVTDSAAAGTALATGTKTNNGTIALSPDGQRLTTALEVAEAGGKATGLVASCSLTHATPASFAAHVPNRKDDQSIAAQMATSGVDVLFGGGWAWFAPRGTDGSKRSDDADPLAQLRQRMPIVRDGQALAALDQVDAAAGFFADGHPPAADRRNPDLASLTTKALAILDRDPDGFFLMVEGSQIDWAGHSNDADHLLAELQDFDAAVGVALAYARAHDDTLVVVTADHETGGFALLDGDAAKRQVGKTAFATKKHSAAMVPLFALGPGSQRFAGLLDNTDVGRRLIDLLR